MEATKKLKRPTGRPPKLNEELIGKICNLLRAGAYPEVAAASCGVAREHFVLWMRKGAKSWQPSVYKDLLSGIEQALADFESRSLAMLDRAGTGIPTQYAKDEQGNIIRDRMGDPVVSVPGVKPDWKATAWRLERRLKSWAPKQIIDLNTSSNEDTRDMTDDQLREKAAKLLTQIQSRGENTP